MDVARLNFSHGDYADHEGRLRPGAQGLRCHRSRGRHPGRSAGAEDPTGAVRGGSTEWVNGETVRITVEDCVGTHDRVSTTYKQLARDAQPGIAC